MLDHHPAYSSRSAIDRAIDRDIDDAERLAHIEGLILGWLDTLAPDADPLRHPDIRWQPGDLIGDLQSHLADIRCEQARLRGPLVLDHEC